MHPSVTHQGQRRQQPLHQTHPHQPNTRFLRRRHLQLPLQQTLILAETRHLITKAGLVPGDAEHAAFCPTCLWKEGQTCGQLKDALMTLEGHTEQESINLLMTPDEENARIPCDELLHDHEYEHDDIDVSLTDTPDEAAAEVTIEAPSSEETVTTTNENPTTPALEDSTVVTEEEDLILTAFREAFCGECVWIGGITCGARATYVMHKYQQTELAAMQGTVGSDDNTCIKEGATVLQSFCGTCSWHGKITCDNRVQYVMDKYESTKDETQQGLLKEGKCTDTEEEGKEST
jgi:hypothetical protein